MLHEFLRMHRAELTARCQAKVAKRPSPASTATALGRGVPALIDQLVQMLRAEQPGSIDTVKATPRAGASSCAAMRTSSSTMSSAINSRRACRPVVSRTSASASTTEP